MDQRGQTENSKWRKIDVNSREKRRFRSRMGNYRIEFQINYLLAKANDFLKSNPSAHRER